MGTLGAGIGIPRYPADILMASERSQYITKSLHNFLAYVGKTKRSMIIKVCLSTRIVLVLSLVARRKKSEGQQFVDRRCLAWRTRGMSEYDRRVYPKKCLLPQIQSNQRVNLRIHGNAPAKCCCTNRVLQIGKHECLMCEEVLCLR